MGTPPKGRIPDVVGSTLAELAQEAPQLNAEQPIRTHCRALVEAQSHANHIPTTDGVYFNRGWMMRT